MEFKLPYVKPVLLGALAFFLLIIIVVWRSTVNKQSIDQENEVSMPQEQSKSEVVLSPISHLSTGLPAPVRGPVLDTSSPDDAAIEEQLDRDRQEQKETKYLKIKLEQTNLELDQEKALAQINKLKMDNLGSLKEPMMDGQKNFPEVRVDYIGGDSSRKEAILSIAGISFQVKENSNPTDNIKVLTISDSSVTVHFSTPFALTRSFDYKPE